jgi:hypothetical protein
MQPWNFTSPIIPEPERLLRECPVGLILRETPDAYTALTYESWVESGAVDPTKQSPWMGLAIRVVSAERARVGRMRREQEASERKAKSDADYANRATKSRRRR